MRSLSVEIIYIHQILVPVAAKHQPDYDMRANAPQLEKQTAHKDRKATTSFEVLLKEHHGSVILCDLQANEDLDVTHCLH